MIQLPCIVLVLAFGSASVAAQSTDVTGDWEITINSPQGTRNTKATLKQEGEKLTGVFKGSRGELPLEGTVKGKEIKFSYTIKFQDNDMAITMTGDFDGESMKGAADFGGFATGDWSAKRAVETAPKPEAQAPTAGSSTAEMIDVSGAWIFEVETAAGSGSPSFTFKQDGEQLTGQYKGIFGEAPVTGTVKGNTITFSFKVNAQGMEGTVVYGGTVEKGSMKGTVTLGDLGSGTWTARRQ